MRSKIVRYRFRFHKKVTTIGIKSHIIALYLVLNDIKKDRHIFMRNTISSFLKDMDYRKSPKGLSEAISVKLIEQVLEGKDVSKFYRHLTKLNDEVDETERG